MYKLSINKRYICFVFIMILTLCFNTVTLYAGIMPDKLPKKESAIAEKLYKYMIANGYTPEAACGVLANVDNESNFDANAVNPSSHAKSFFQMLPTQFNNMQAWAEKHKLDPYDITVQFRWVESLLEHDFKAYLDNVTCSDFKSTKDVIFAMEAFLAAYERGVGGSYTLTKVKLRKGYGPYKYQGGPARISYAKGFLKKFAGIEVTDSDGKLSSNGDKDSTKIKKTKDGVKIGNEFYSEAELAAYIKLAETNVESEYLDNATRENLGQDDLSSLAGWSNNVENSKAEYGFIAMMRIIVMWVGIFFTVWVLLVYLAYWFDRINTFFYVDLLHILTFGKLHISPEEKECTFGKNSGSSKDITVNHKAILMICLTGLIFGATIISGVFYTAVSGAVNFILRQLGI